MARRTRTLARFGLALSCAAALGLGAGCGTGSGVSDSKIVAALDLQQAGHGYRMGGDPFCTVEDLLNDGDQVSQAHDRQERPVSSSPPPTGKSAWWQSARSPPTAPARPSTGCSAWSGSPSEAH